MLIVQEEQCCIGGMCAFQITGTARMCVSVCVLWVVCPECDGAVGRGGEEGQVFWVPPALDHLVTVLSHHGLRQRLGQVTLKHKKHKNTAQSGSYRITQLM